MTVIKNLIQYLINSVHWLLLTGPYSEPVHKSVHVEPVPKKVVEPVLNPFHTLVSNPEDWPVETDLTGLTVVRKKGLMKTHVAAMHTIPEGGSITDAPVFIFPYPRPHLLSTGSMRKHLDEFAKVRGYKGWIVLYAYNQVAVGGNHIKLDDLDTSFPETLGFIEGLHKNACCIITNAGCNLSSFPPARIDEYTTSSGAVKQIMEFMDKKKIPSTTINRRADYRTYYPSSIYSMRDKDWLSGTVEVRRPILDQWPD